MSISPLRQRMIGDMTSRRIGEKAQKNYIRCVRSLAAFIGRSRRQRAITGHAVSADKAVNAGTCAPNRA